MTYPLIMDLAADCVPVEVTCRVMGFSKQRYYRWKANAVMERDWFGAHLVNAARDIHGDDPAFGYRFITDELPGTGIVAGENRVQRLFRYQGVWSVFCKKRGLNRKPGAPVHDALVERDYSAKAPNQLWLTDITEHPATENKLYLCAVKDVYSGKIVQYSTDSRMKSYLALARWRTLCGHQGCLTRQDLRLVITTWIERTYRQRRQRRPGKLTHRILSNKPGRADSGLRPPVNKAGAVPPFDYEG